MANGQTVEDLGRLVKAKYPQYSDLSDIQVGTLAKAKYPDAYSDFADISKGPGQYPSVPSDATIRGPLTWQEKLNNFARDRVQNLPMLGTAIGGMLGGPAGAAAGAGLGAGIRKATDTSLGGGGGIPLTGEGATDLGQEMAYRGAQGAALDVGAKIGGKVLGRLISGPAAKVSAQDALNTLVGRIAGTPEATSKLTAGESVQAAVANKIPDIDAAQQEAFDMVHQISNQNMEPVKGQYVPGAGPTTLNMPAPVSTKTAKAAIESMAAKGEELPAVLTKIRTGPDYLPLPAAENVLEQVKAAGTKSVIEPLQDAIDTKAESIGALDHLNVSRALKNDSYATARLLNDMEKEPVRLVDYLTESGDRSIGQLRQIAKTVPGELPNIGESYLKGMLQNASGKGRFDPSVAAQQWDALGAETKKLLFGDQLNPLNDLFSTMTQRISQPSGSIASLINRLGTYGGAAIGGYAGSTFGTQGAALGAAAGGTGGRMVANLINGRLNIGGAMMLSADQTAKVLMTKQGPALLKSAMMMPMSDPSAQQLTKVLLIISGRANTPTTAQQNNQ